MQRRGWSCVTLIAMAVVAVGAVGIVRPDAQTPPAGAPPQQPTFRTRIDAVSVDAIVTDKKGNPVTDLTAADFEVREGGKVQRIESFKLIQIDDARDADPSSLRQILSMQDQEREAAKDDVRLIIIFLDDYHVRLGNSMAARGRIAEFVRQINPRDLVAIMYPLTPVTALTFSRNRDEMARAVEKFQGRKYNYQPMNAVEENYQYAQPQQKEQIRNGVVMTALRGACTYLGTLRDGRKTVLFVSEGFGSTLPASLNQPIGGIASGVQASRELQDRGTFFNSLSLQDDLKQVYAAANRSNTAVYTLDPRGLATSEFDVSDPFVSYEQDRSVLQETMDSLRTLADQTDGRAIVNRNNFSTDLNQMLRDTGAYYLLGYTSTEAPRDGKFHEIKVSVKRKDVELRARKGYWAYTADEIARATAPPKPALPAAITNALSTLSEPPRAHAVRSWIATARGADGKTEVTLVWEAVAGDSSARPPARVTLTALSPDGGDYFRGPVERDPQAAQAGGHATFAARPGVVRLRIIATAADGQVLDTEERDVAVPDFTGTAPSLSTPLVFRARTARDVQQIRAAAAPQPTTAREFTRAERLLVRFHAYGPGGVTPAVTIRFLNQNGQAMATLPAPTVLTDGGLESEISLAPLAAGDYLIEIGATAETGTVQALIAFRIAG